MVVLGGIFLHGLMVLFPLITTFATFIIVCFFYGICGALVLPAATAIMVDEGRTYGMGSVMGLFNMSMNLGLAVGPPAGGWLADAFGLNAVFYLFSFIGFFGISLFWIGSRDMNYQQV
jgi:MFS family permease